MAKQMAYDSECWNLAEHFLTGEPIPPEREREITELLAQEIQDCVESFCTSSLPHLLAPKPAIENETGQS